MKFGEVGCITRIILIDREGMANVVLFVRIFGLENNAFIVNKHVTVDHIRKCCDTDCCTKIFKPEDIVGQCVIIKSSNIHYISIIPKGCFGE